MVCVREIISSQLVCSSPFSGCTDIVSNSTGSNCDTSYTSLSPLNSVPKECDFKVSKIPFQRDCVREFVRVSKTR